MAFNDWIRTGTTSGPLTREALDRAFEAVKQRGSEPRHDCRRDGHVALFMSTRCFNCHARIRELTVDENHVRLGEFW